MPSSSFSQKSEVWNFFTKKSSNICTCNLCGKQYKSGGGTTNLRNHILHKHEVAYRKRNLQKTDIEKKDSVNKKRTNQQHTDCVEDVGNIASEIEIEYSDDSTLETISVKDAEKDQLSDSSFSATESSKSQSPTTVTTPTSRPSTSCSRSHFAPFSPTQPTLKYIIDQRKSYEAGGSKGASITQALLYMVCKDYMPLNCTEKQGMKFFLKTALPLYSPPCRKTITTLMEGKYKTLQNIVIQKLSTISTVALTTDIATVLNATRSFIVLTLHFIDEEKLTITQISLGAKNLTPHHNADNICSDLSEMLNMWQIPKKKIVSVTTDNGANIVAGVQKLLADIDSDIHVSCFAHNINLVVSKALGDENVSDIVAIITKVKNIVTYFKHSNVAQDDLRKEQRNEGKTDGTFLYLIQEVATRWNSTYYCLERFKVLSGHIGKILLSPHHNKAPPMTTPLELAIIDECLQVLKPFEAATVEISREKYISGSLVIPLTFCIRTALYRVIVSSELIETFKSNLCKQLERRLDPLEKNILLSVATIIDPRFKKLHFSSPRNAADAISRIKKEVTEVIKSQGLMSPPEVEVHQQDSKLSALSSIWKIHEEIASKQESSARDIIEGLPAELKLYLHHPIIPRYSNPIQYWIKNKNAFPAMFQVAAKYLTIQGASVSSERVVSTLNNICTDKRSRLTPEHANQLVFLSTLNKDYWNL